MRRTWQIWILLSAFLLQGMGPVVHVLSFLLQRDRIVRTHCVNLAKPELQCRGKCYLVQQLEADMDKPDTPASVQLVTPWHLFFPPDTGMPALALLLGSGSALPLVLEPPSHRWIAGVHAPPWPSSFSLSL
jgi:hypothetical protein